ncbi:MAG TPA: hypothetical protein ENF16_05495 [Bacteroidetes bacterium]|nr:hypothetical protein [Bacteroidota bacterium]
MRRFRFVVTLFLLALFMGCAGTRKPDPEMQRRVEYVKGAMTAVANALQFYYNDHGFFPKGMATLRDADYLALAPDVEREWELKYYTGGGQVMMVEAISRSTMPDGEGHKIIYRLPDESWEGYGITEFP